MRTRAASIHQDYAPLAAPPNPHAAEFRSAWQEYMTPVLANPPKPDSIVPAQASDVTIEIVYKEIPEVSQSAEQSYPLAEPRPIRRYTAGEWGVDIVLDDPASVGAEE